jgi:pyruvate dehydrogenase E2 component (dihydrolipoamide acetyltransferase)
MPIRVEMPRLSDTMEEGTLLKWRVKVGDKVSPGDVLADVETDKATMELAAYEDGTIAKLVADEGATMPIGKLILVMAKAGETIEDAAGAAGDAATAGASQSKAATTAAAAKGGATAVLEAPATAPTPASVQGRARVSPLAKKLAKDANIEVTALQGTGPDGRIIKRDIEAAVASGASKAAKAPASAKPPAAPASLQSRLVTITGMRKTIAKRLVESKQTIPHFQVTMTINADPLMTLRSVINSQLESQGVKLSVNDFVVKATAIALTKHAVVNSSWTDAGIQYHGTVNIGIAVALPEERGGGLVVPTLYSTHTTDLRTISAETKRLAKKARETGLTVDEMSNGTFTISNLGMFGVDHFTAIINPPQAAILAVGAGVEKAVARGGKIVIGQEMSMTLSADHRVVDGATAAQFLVTIKELLENPAAMLV